MTTMSNLLCDVNFVFDALCAFVHKSTLASTRIRLYSFHFPDVGGSSPIIGATQYESRAAGGLAPPAGCPFFFFFSFHRLRLLARPIFFQVRTFSHSPHSLFISQSLANPHPPSLPPSYPPPPPVPPSPLHPPAGSDVNALPIRLSIRQTCATRSSGCPEALACK